MGCGLATPETLGSVEFELPSPILRKYMHAKQNNFRGKAKRWLLDLMKQCQALEFGRLSRYATVDVWESHGSVRI